MRTPKVHRLVVPLARCAVKKSDCYMKMAAVLVKGKRVVSVGHNRRHWRRSKTNPEQLSIHAEIDALRRVSPDEAKGATLYVARFNAVGTSRLAAPCDNCARVIREYGVKVVCYTISPDDNEGVRWERWP